MKKILVFHRSPFGVSTDWYYLCVLGVKYFSIDMLCMSGDIAKINDGGVNVEYVSNSGGRLVRAFRLFSSLRKKVAANCYDTIIIPYFPGCWLIPLLLWKVRKRILVDIRSGDINKNRYIRSLNNCLLRVTTFLYSNISILSLELAGYLKLSSNKLHHLPLGGNVINCGNKRFDNLSLLYVGTFHNRDLDKVVRAVAVFRRRHNDDININLTMIGDGPERIREHLSELAQHLKVDDICIMPGFIPHRELLPYMQKCNVGLSFIPMLPAYEYQPPTKTFEYVLAGMPVIATKTFANQQFVTHENGILCEDTVDSLVWALEEHCKKMMFYNSNLIRDSLRDYSWVNIVDNKFKPIIDSIAG